MKNRNWDYRVLRLVVTISVVLLAASGLNLAQETSTIQGHISDSQGASVPKAQVKVTNESTGVSRSAFSAEDGYYRIPDLLPGIYEVRVELTGFKTIIRSSIEVTSKSVTGLNFTLEVGEMTQTVNVTSEEPQVETQTARVTEVISEKEVKSLPLLGRGILNLAFMTPGITARPESGSGNYCCDAFSTYAAPEISSGGSEVKSNFTVDGINMRYTEGSVWAMAFSPNQDAVNEVRVSVNPDTAEFGNMSGPQFRVTTKGGTNTWHGTAHVNANQDNFNAVPFGSTRDAVPNTYKRLFGGTGGGAIVKDRLFIFGAYEGLRERRATSSVALAETQAFKDFVVGTRPNTIGAKLLQDYPPFRYPTSGLVDLGSPEPGILTWSTVPDGIPDIGEVILDRPTEREGYQFNGRVDYSSPSGNDRIYGSYWYTHSKRATPDLRDAFWGPENLKTQFQNVVYTHSFSPNILNEARFGHFNILQRVQSNSRAYNIPGISTDDGISLGSFAWSDQRFAPNVYEFGNIISINRGRHQIKLGGAYRHATNDLQTFLSNDIPTYGFGSLLDFADDEPYVEARTFDLNSGQPLARIRPLFFKMQELSFFVANTWQLRPNLTLNYGLRYESFFNNWLGNGRNNWQPVLSSDQLNPTSVASVINQKVDRYYNTDKNNLSPRLGLAWDPSGQGKISIRGAFALLHDEINSFPLYDTGINPPDAADVVGGVQEGIPIVYGLAPAGTLDFPVNPNLVPTNINAVGGFDGQRVQLGALVTDLKNPAVYDILGGVQYQLFTDLMVHADYKYRRCTNDLYGFNTNRFAGDLADGLLDRLNPNWSGVLVTTNLGKRFYHGLILGASKRFSQGWQLSANYTYNHGRSNFGTPNNSNYASNATEAYNPQFDSARDDIAHVFTMHSVWELPILRGRSGWLAAVFGGWQLNTIWQLLSGGPFFPITDRIYGQGGDFNADGQGGERPDLPTGDVPHSFSRQEWLNGALTADLFPLPSPSDIRPGTLPRDFFRGPGSARVDAAFVKAFPIPIGRAEKAQLQLRAEAFNLFNRINIREVANALEQSNFGRATSAYQMRIMQLSVKFVF